MPRRAIFLSVLACLCLAPDAALAGPVSKLDATPAAAGMQVDPSAAITSTRRLVAATDVTGGADRVRVWNRATGDAVTATLVSGSPARQPSLAWDGGLTAHLATASSAGCPSSGRISTWSYTVQSGVISPSPETLVADPLGANVSQTWPRTVLAAAGTGGLAGRPIVVADQEDCGTHEHAIVVAWDAPAHNIGDLTRTIAEPTGPTYDKPRYPDAAVLGADGGETSIIIAYLGELSGGKQDVRVRQCLIGDLNFNCTKPPVTIDQITPAGTITKGGTSLNAIAAPSIACGGGACTVVWTEAGGGGSRVFRSRAMASDPMDPTSDYTSWPSGTQVAAAPTTSGSQLLPSVAVAGSRTDVVYANLNDDGTVNMFQTSFDGTARGDDVSLLDGPAYSPPAASLGQRTDAVELASGPSPALTAYFPDDNGLEGTVSEAQVAHGTTQPILAAAGATKTIGKNTSFDPSPWLAFDDPDGDPATVTVDDPGHGSVAGGVYTADPSYAGSDTVTVRATYGATTVSSSHAITITNQAPVLDALSPAIADEGGAIVTVPLHAVDPDANDAVVYSIAYAESPLNVAGRATIVGATLRLDIPAGVRALAPLRITLRALDTTTGLAALDDYQDLSVTIRPDLATPSTLTPSINVTGSRATLTARVSWIDPSNGCLTTVPLGCHVRRVWSFGDGTPSVTTTDQPTIEHPYVRAGRYSGQVTTWVLWGASQVASDPKPFTVPIQDDGRVVAAITPKSVRPLSRTKRQVQLVITARATGTVWISIKVGNKILNKRQVPLVAGRAIRVRMNVSISGLHSHRATIRLYGWGMVASNIPPTDVYRTIILR
jgi:hypothetical protein